MTPEFQNEGAAPPSASARLPGCAAGGQADGRRECEIVDAYANKWSVRVRLNDDDDDELPLSSFFYSVQILQ